MGDSLTRYKNIIISPHADDEAFFCFSVLNKDSLVLILCNEDADIKRSNVSRLIADKIGYKLKFLGFTDLEFYKDLRPIIIAIENEFKLIDCDNLYYPCLTSHQDHKILNMALDAVLRPKKNNFKSIYQFPYWDRKLDYNAIKKVDEMKFDFIKKYNLDDWFNYIESMNKYIAISNCIEGYCEPFKLIWSQS